MTKELQLDPHREFLYDELVVKSNAAAKFTAREEVTAGAAGKGATTTIHLNSGTSCD
jgi:hypothetical protein